MSSQRHQQHLSSYMKSRKNSPVKDAISKSATSSGTSSGTCSSHPTQSRTKGQQKQQPPNVKPYLSRAKKPARNADNINRLPDELVFSIFKLLQPAELLICAQVCTRWSALTKDRVLWEGIFPSFPIEIRKLFSFGETREDNFDWKKEIIKRCVKARNSRFTVAKKKLNPYTGLQANIPDLLKGLSINWKLCFTDTRGENHWVTADESTYFASSVSVRWLSFQLPPVAQLKQMKLYASVPVFFNKSWKPQIKSATTCSKLLSYDLKSKGNTLRKNEADVDDDMITAHFLTPGLIAACWTTSWKDGGELAFVTACFNYHNLLQRALLGSSTEIYQQPSHKPILGGISTKYGLYGYSAMVELRNHKSSYWSQQFRELYHDDSTSDSVILRGHLSEYGVFNKRCSLPWKTELFRNILKNVGIIDLTVVSRTEDKPVWCISSPVKVHVNESQTVDYSNDGERFFIEYSDDIGSLRIDLTWDSEEGQTRVVDVEFRIRKSFVNL